ncbi:lysophospholipid acyltransferase family protein [Flavobacteriaceae bacterium]|nr:lysophospholipid acyltransferase family protein [Flavobacteriaceae bacterium]
MHLLVFILIYPHLWVVSKLPRPLFYLLSDIFFIKLFYFFGYRKKVVMENLILCFPNKDLKELQLIRRQFYSHLCDLFMEMVKTMNLSKAGVKERYQVQNIDYLKEVLKTKSVLLVCSHYANWEWNVSINNYISEKGYAVYQKIGNPYFDAWIKKLRSRWNTTPMTQAETFRTIMQNEKEGIKAVYGMVADQSPPMSKAKAWGSFMGINVPVYNGAEVLAQKLDLAVVFLRVKKVKRGVFQATFETITTSGTHTAPGEITKEFFLKAESQIKEEPAHYLWTHKRWKHRGKKQTDH